MTDISNPTTLVLQNHSFNYEKLKKYLFETLSAENNLNKTKLYFFQIFDTMEVTQFPNGQSNPTFLINFNKTNEKFVLRKKPKGKLLKSAHLIDREFKMISKLHKINFPVPKAILYCSDTEIIGEEFYIMEYIEGRIFRDFRLRKFSPKERFEIYTELIRVLALLHNVNWQALEIDLFQKANNFNDYYQKQIAIWSKQYRLSETNKIEEMDFLIDFLLIIPP